MEEKAALEEMRRLAAQYKLSFTFNPGGGEFYKDGWRCQISCEDDVYDLECLKKALADIINPN